MGGAQLFPRGVVDIGVWLFVFDKCMLRVRIEAGIEGNRTHDSIKLKQ